MEQNEKNKKIDRFNVRCFNHDTLKNRIDNLAKIRKISSNQLILNILEEYLERNEMKSYSKRYILEEAYNFDKGFKISIVILGITIIYLIISSLSKQMEILNAISKLSFGIVLLSSIFVAIYISWYLFSEIYTDFYAERILKQNNIKLDNIIDCNPKEAIVVKKLSIGEIYRFNKNIEGEFSFKTKSNSKWYYLFDNYFFFSENIINEKS